MKRKAFTWRTMRTHRRMNRSSMRRTFVQLMDGQNPPDLPEKDDDTNDGNDDTVEGTSIVRATVPSSPQTPSAVP